jgi:multisubunit Na+/H+ antiporter MnhB subunit
MTSLALVLDGLLALLILGLALWVLVTGTSFRAALGFTLFGLLAALIWVRMDASDVALTAAALSGGLTGILFLVAARRLPREESAIRPGLGIRLLVGLVSILVTVGISLLVVDATQAPAVSLAPLVTEHLAATGLGNPVTGVLLGFRALDSLTEGLILVMVLVALWSLVPDPEWGGRPNFPHLPRPAPGLRLLARALLPGGLLVGLYLAWIGSHHPGGPFQGGAILAAMWLLAMIAGLMRPPAVSSWALRWLLITGPLVFILVGFASNWLDMGFLADSEGWARYSLLIIKAGLTLSIAIALGLLLASPAASTSGRDIGP